VLEVLEVLELLELPQPAITAATQIAAAHQIRPCMRTPLSAAPAG
jgi:hypothetical protein